MASLFRRASKKSLSQIHQNHTTQDLTSPTDSSSSSPAMPKSLQPPLSLGDENVPEQSVKPGSVENVEEHGGDPAHQPHIGQERALRPGHLKEEGPSLTPNTLHRQSQVQARASSDMEEVLSGGSQSNEGPDSSSSPLPCNASFHPLSPSLIASGEKAPLSSPCPSPELSKFDLPCSEIETPPDQIQPPPASVSESGLEHLPSRSSSPDLQNVTYSQSPALPSLTFISLAATSSPTHAALLLQGSEDDETEVNDALWPYLATSFHNSEDIACSISSSDPLPLSPPSNLDCPFSGHSDSLRSPKKTEVVLVSGILSSTEHPSPTCLSLSAPLDFQCPPSFISFLLTESFTQGPEDKSEESVFSDPRESDLSEKPRNPSFQQEEHIPSAPLPPVLDSFKLEHDFPTLPSLSHETFTPVSPPAVSSKLQPDPNLVHLAAGIITDPTEQFISQQGRSCSPDDDNTDLIPTSVQEVSHEKMDHLSMDLDDNLQKDTNGDAAVCISDAESSGGLSEGSGFFSEQMCHQTDKDRLAETKQEELREDCQMEINDIDGESPTSYFVVNNHPELDCRADMEPRDLTEGENLDMVFETSVDGLESENGDIDAFFQQLDSEGRVYWAEPIQVSNSSYVLEESGSFESLDGSQWNSLSSRDLAALESVSLPVTTTTTASSDPPSSLVPPPVQSHPVTPDAKLSSHSVSTQMSSSISSHIVHRKDVPYEADSKHSPLPSVFPLDTSSPYRAVQAWTDLQIQRNIKKLSNRALSVPHEAAAPVGAAGKTHRSTLVYSSSPSFPLMSNDSRSHDRLPAMAKNYRTVSVSVDTGLGPDKEEEVYRSEGREFLWGGNRSVTVNCCCSCEHQCCCAQESHSDQHTLGNTPYSLGDLEEMMLSLQQYCSMHSNMEEQLSENQTSIYSALSDIDRETIEDLEVLRRAVRQEAGELETQLNQLAHHHDDSLKMQKMRRLLDEQSLLCTRLRVFQPDAEPRSSHSTPNRTVATQCCLPPWIGPADTHRDHDSSWSMTNIDSLRHSPPGSASVCKDPFKT
ncbi:hypothetical protein JOB18_003046 [Solea senegalensis]|nr:hypothetical protein JOB18_003046 [Solea senegalensis]